MISKLKSTAGLPIKGNLTALCACTLVILVLMIGTSVAGVLYSHSVYPADDLRRMFLPNDVVNLCIELPFMLVSLLLIWQSKLTGLLALPGALLSVLYNYLVYDRLEIAGLDEQVCAIVLASAIEYEAFGKPAALRAETAACSPYRR